MLCLCDLKGRQERADSVTKGFCISNCSNETKYFRLRYNILQTSHCITSAFFIIAYSCKQRPWHHGPTEITGNSSRIWCGFLHASSKTFHVRPRAIFNHLSSWYVEWRTSAMELSSCCRRLPPGPSSAELTASVSQRAPLQTWAQTLHTSLEWGKEDLTLSALCAGLLPAPLYASLLMSALLLHTFPNSPQFLFPLVTQQTVPKTFKAQERHAVDANVFLQLFIRWTLNHLWFKLWIRNENGGCLFSVCLAQLSAQHTLMTPGCHYRVAYRLWKHLRAV